MATEKIIGTHQRGVAMFVVLSAILLVVLFGYVGLTLAGKDQTLTGDLNDIKSRDEAAISGLQLGVNRLVENPAQMIALFNAFILEGRTSKAAPQAVWFDLNAANLTLVKNEPAWFGFGSGSADSSAVKLQLLAISQGDTSAIPSEGKDSTAVYIALRCKSRGRHRDEKLVQGTYRIHGVTVERSVSTVTFTYPKHALYVGGNYVSPNMKLGTQGGEVYVGGTGGSFLNSGAGHAIEGDLKWNGDLKLNPDGVHVKGNLYIRGMLYTNGGVLEVDGNAGIQNGLDEMNGSKIIVHKNLWLGGVGTVGSWNGSGGLIQVGGDFVFIPSGARTPRNLKVGGSAWIVNSAFFPSGATDSFHIGNRLYFGDSVSNRNLTISGGVFRVDSSVIFSGGGKLSVPGGYVGDTLQVNRTLATSAALNVVRVAQVDTQIGVGSITGATLTPRAGKTNWRHLPTQAQLGIDTNLMKTAPADNPMDSVKVDNSHSPLVNSKVVELNSSLFLAAGVASSATSEISAANFNLLYTYLKQAGKLLNGYMVLHIGNGSGITNFSGNTTVGFDGKLLLVVETVLNPNGAWPHSTTKDNVQVLLVRKRGAMDNFGWKGGNFAGILYWENPCGIHNLNITGGILYGAILLGTTLTTPGYGYTAADLAGCATGSFIPNPGSVDIIRDSVVFQNIGQNLPGILVPAKDAGGNPTSQQGTATITTTTPFLRLVLGKPYFEPVGIFR